MAKRRFEITEAKIARFVREGRGMGDGASYKPWLTVHDLSSTGRVSRLIGRHNRRIHHLFSDIETNSFLEYDWNDDVLDIKEQFPLDRATTRVIAAEMGVRHPRDPHTRVDIVMTTDLLITCKGGIVRPVACKAAEGLANARTREKLEIERRYWKLLGREWKIRTEQSICKVRAGSLSYLHEFIDADRWHWIDVHYWPVRTSAFLALLGGADPSRPFMEFAASFDRLAGFAPGDAVATMRYLACRKVIDFKLDVKFDHSAPIGRSIALLCRTLQEAA